MSAPAWPIHPLSVDQFSRMFELGVLDPDERVELLEGVIVPITFPSPQHALAVGRVADLLRDASPAGWHVREEKSLVCGEHSLPQPDVALVRGQREDYHHRHPAGSDVVLVIEVAWTSHDRDRAKAGLYARAGVPTYALVDVPNAKLVLYTRPNADGYQTVETSSDAGLTLAEPSVELSLAELLGPLAHK